MKQSNSTLFANSSSLARNLRVVLSKKKEHLINASEQVPYGGIIIAFSFGETKYVKITDGVKTVNLLPKIGVGGEGGDVDIPIGTDRQVLGYVNGEASAVTLGWKQFSDLPSVPPFSNGVLTGTAFDENGNALFAFIELATEGFKAASIPLYKSNGRMSVGNATEPDDAICLGQINGVLKAIQGYNASGTQTLTHINGTLQWV